MGSSQTRAQTRVLRIGRSIPIYCSTREVLFPVLLTKAAPSWFPGVCPTLPTYQIQIWAEFVIIRLIFGLMRYLPCAYWCWWVTVRRFLERGWSWTFSQRDWWKRKRSKVLPRWLGKREKSQEQGLSDWQRTLRRVCPSLWCPFHERDPLGSLGWSRGCWMFWGKAAVSEPYKEDSARFEICSLVRSIKGFSFIYLFF